KSFTDPYGEIWTPFAIVRADAINASISNQPGVSNFLPVGDTNALRVMPTVGLEYRYPFINIQPWGSTTVEPIAQIIIRPNETYAGKFPNEDAQSMVFDASNLFSVDKFSGYDRVEGGGRANVGVQATTQFDKGGAVKMLFGNYAPQPELGYLTRREGILTSGSLKVATNWVVTGSARWDLEANKLNQYVLGAGYVDDCFVLAANYVTSYSYSAGSTPPVL